jgi:phosphoglycolate phosphatase
MERPPKPLTAAPRQSDRRLVLWDVDLTLVRAGPIGRELYAAAFTRVTGRPMRFQAPMSGRLDPDIFRDTLAAHGLDPADHSFPRFADALAAVYSARSGELREQGGALPGAAGALAALAGLPLAVQTVLTGNVRAVAAVKLTAFGLDRYVDLDIGAYGADAAVRADLVRLAQQRAGAKHRATFDADRTVLIGDSRNDVVAGRDGGARVVAVATGRDSEADLLAAGADVVLPDLTDTTALLRAVRDGL